MSKNPNTDNNTYIAALFAALITALLATVFFLVEAIIQNAGLKEFIQGISGNIIATTLSFLIVYIFIISRSALGKQREENLLDELKSGTNQLKAELFQRLDQITMRLETEIAEKLDPNNKNNFLSLRLDSFRAELLSEVREMGTQIGNLVNTKLDLDSNDLYSFYGLKGVSTGINFQNFMVSRDAENENINAVSYLWADTLVGNTINAKIICDEMDPFLRIEFESLEPGWGCNINLRPQNERAVRLEGQGLNYLYFKVRIPCQALENPELLRDIGIAVRIVNGKYQHWDYASRAGEYRQFQVNGDGTWTPIFVDLQDKRRWCHFESDGNQYISEEDISNANLSVISGVVIKLGRFRPGTRGELGYGKGIVDVKDVRFSPNQPY
jgi:hypothetical protein